MRKIPILSPKICPQTAKTETADMARGAYGRHQITSAPRCYAFVSIFVMHFYCMRHLSLSLPDYTCLIYTILLALAVSHLLANK